MATETTKRLFTVHDYHRMADAGILSEADRVELIRGEIVLMSPIGPPHNGAVLRASNSLFPIVGNRAVIGVQGSVRLGEYDEPQPDLFLLRPRDDFYTEAHAGPEDIFLIIEIADSSLDYDRSVKAAVYAEAGVPEYWVSDIPHDCIWMYSDVREHAYATVRRAVRGETYAPRLLEGCSIPVDVLLP